MSTHPLVSFPRPHSLAFDLVSSLLWVTWYRLLHLYVHGSDIVHRVLLVTAGVSRVEAAAPWRVRGPLLCSAVDWPLLYRPFA